MANRPTASARSRETIARPGRTRSAASRGPRPGARSPYESFRRDHAGVLARLAQENATYRGIATSAGRPSEDAFRVALARALTRLAREMQRLETPR